MASTKISALAPAAALAASDSLPVVQGGATRRATGQQLIDLIAPAAVRRLPKVSWHGDSIALLTGNMEPASPYFWSLVRQPRALVHLRTGTDQGGQFAVSGSKSGPLWSGPGRTGTLLSAGNGNDMNDAARLAAVTAYAPDIMFFQIGSNESAVAAALDATILNTRDVIAANPNPHKRVVFIATFPKALSDAHLAHYTRWQEQMARSVPGYYFIDWRSIATDETTASGGSLGNYSSDGTHPQASFGRAAAFQFDQLFDRLGIEKISPRGVSQADVYNAATAPGGNLMGTRGLFLGTGGAAGTGGASGVWASGTFLTSTNNAELTAVGSKGTFVDRRGQAHQAQIVTFGTSGGALTGERSFSMSVVLPATQPAGRQMYAQLLAQFANLSGCVSIGYVLTSSNGANVNAQMGTGQSQTLTALSVLPTSATPENLDMVLPIAVVPDAGNTAGFQMKITATFLAGSTPAGTIAFGAAGVWPEIAVP